MKKKTGRTAKPPAKQPAPLKSKVDAIALLLAELAELTAALTRSQLKTDAQLNRLAEAIAEQARETRFSFDKSSRLTQGDIQHLARHRADDIQEVAQVIGKLVRKLTPPGQGHCLPQEAAPPENEAERENARIRTLPVIEE